MHLVLLLNVVRIKVNKMVDKTKRKNYMQSRITEGKKEIGAKSLDSSKQYKAFQKYYAKGLKAQEDQTRTHEARKSWKNAMPKSGFPQVEKNLNIDRIKSKNPDNENTKAYIKGVEDMQAALKYKEKDDMKKGGRVKKKKYCKDGCAIRGKTKGKLL
jgi:hypothetical protein